MSPATFAWMIAALPSAENRGVAPSSKGLTANSTCSVSARWSAVTSPTKPRNSSLSVVTVDDCTTTCSTSGSLPRASSRRSLATCESRPSRKLTSLTKTPPATAEKATTAATPANHAITTGHRRWALQRANRPVRPRSSIVHSIGRRGGARRDSITAWFLHAKLSYDNRPLGCATHSPTLASSMILASGPCGVRSRTATVPSFITCLTMVGLPGFTNSTPSCVSTMASCV